MTIDDIKAGLNQPVLKMARQLDENKEKTKWLSHWDGENRIRVTMHEDIGNRIKANKELDTLEMKEEKVISRQTGIQYTRYIVFIQSPPPERNKERTDEKEPYDYSIDRNYDKWLQNDDGYPYGGEDHFY